MRPQADLLRIAAQGGEAVPDPGKALPGRGGYLCPQPRCAAQAAKGRQISRALKGRVSEPPLDRVLGWLGGAGFSPSAARGVGTEGRSLDGDEGGS